MSVTKIVRVHGRQVLDSRGNPTVEALVTLADGGTGNGLVDVVHADGAVVRVDYVNGVNAKSGTITSVRTFDFAGLTISTTPGYDNTTGLGVPNGLTFLQRL